MDLATGLSLGFVGLFALQATVDKIRGVRKADFGTYLEKKNEEIKAVNKECELEMMITQLEYDTRILARLAKNADSEFKKSAYSQRVKEQVEKLERLKKEHKIALQKYEDAKFDADMEYLRI